MNSAQKVMDKSALASTYGRFLVAREAAMIGEIRRVCGIYATPDDIQANVEPDEVAADIAERLANGHEEPEGSDRRRS
jgi:hypothetical protein